MTKNEISINYSTAKKFLTSSGCRAAKEAVIAFQKKINEKSVEMATAASTSATDNKRKTVMTEDIENL